MLQLVKGRGSAYPGRCSPGHLLPRAALAQSLLQPTLTPASSFLERVRSGAGRRTLAIGAALLVEALLLLLLLSLGAQKRPGRSQDSITVIDVRSDEAVEAPPEPASPATAPQADERPVAQRPRAETPPTPPVPALLQKPAEPQVMPAPRPLPTQPVERPPSVDVPRFTLPPASAPAPAAGPKRVYGPPNKGGSSAYRDSERVGTAPNGEPLYAAAWYREPRPDQLRGYLSSARGPGWGLIACRTVPDYRVEDCVGLGEYPEGSQITRAVLAAAWEFRVRPARLGGIAQVGSWVRIRIDYEITRR